MRRFERYLPTLQLKQQQLQIEIRHMEAKIDAKRIEEQKARADLDQWVKLYSESFPFEDYLRLEKIHRSTTNIAGVTIPVMERVVFDRREPDLFGTPPWIDEGMRTLELLIRLRLERSFMEIAHRLLLAELRTTTQRVNLFEKVKIPDARENIRIIRIFLGDQQTAEVARAKIAKNKTAEAELAR